MAAVKESEQSVQDDNEGFRVTLLFRCLVQRSPKHKQQQRMKTMTALNAKIFHSLRTSLIQGIRRENDNAYESSRKCYKRMSYMSYF